MAGPVIRRGEVWWVTFHDAVGGEIRKTRPSIVVSNDRSNDLLNRVQVVALTTKVDKVFPGKTLVEVEGQNRKEIASQLHTVAKSRCVSCLGRINDDNMARVENAILFQLGLLSRSHR